jgi:uncharacterized lipoprotein YmbA
MTLERRTRRAIAAAALAAGLAGCGHSAPTLYLTLGSVPPASQPGTPLAATTVRLLAVRWPAAFDRLEVVRPTDEVELSLDEQARWSAALGDLAAAALAQDLRARAPAITLASGAQSGGPDGVDLSVQVVALTLHEGTYVMTATFGLETPDGAALARRTVTLDAPAGGAGAADEAQVLSRLLAALADQIVVDLPDAVREATSPPRAKAGDRW